MKSDYPDTKIENVTEELHGETLVDPYRWLESTSDTHVRKWIGTQNDFTSSTLEQYDGVKKIKSRLLELYHYDVIVQGRFLLRKTNSGIRFFYELRKAGAAQSILYYQDGENGDPKELLNPIKISPDGLVAIDWFVPSPDGRFIAYGISRDGTEKSVLHIINVETAEPLSEQIPGTRYSSIAWLDDCSGFYYTRYPLPGTVPPEEEGYNRHVFFHEIGRNHLDDIKVFGEGRAPNEIAALNINQENSLLVVTCYRFIESDVFISKTDKQHRTDLDFSLVIEGKHAISIPKFSENILYMLTQVDAPNGRILAYDMDQFFDDETARQGRVIVDEGTGVIAMEEGGFALFDGKMAVIEDENASGKLKLYNAHSGELIDTVEFGTLVTIYNLSTNSKISRVYFSVESFFSPPAVAYYESSEKRGYFLKSTIDIDEELFKAEQVWYKSKDGSDVSMFILSKKDLVRSPNTPINLTGYGGFGISLTPLFKPHYLLWVENGGVVAVPNLRGGGEYGQKWHRAGNRENKQNVYDDFISSAEWLIANNIGSTKTMGIHGRSNGGLLVGACLTQRPDLFKSVLCGVPLLDMIRYTNFLIAKYWIPEYGNPLKEEEFKWLLSYSPYHNVKDETSYPATYFYTAEGDSRVDTMHAMKMTAKMQTVTKGNVEDQPILLWVETQAGHGVGMPLEKIVESEAKFMLFQAHHTGMKLDK